VQTSDTDLLLMALHECLTIFAYLLVGQLEINSSLQVTMIRNVRSELVVGHLEPSGVSFAYLMTVLFNGIFFLLHRVCL